MQLPIEPSDPNELSSDFIRRCLTAAGFSPKEIETWRRINRLVEQAGLAQNRYRKEHRS